MLLLLLLLLLLLVHPPIACSHIGRLGVDTYALVKNGLDLPQSRY